MNVRNLLLSLGLLWLLAGHAAVADWVFYSEGPPLSSGTGPKVSRNYYERSSLRSVEPGVKEILHRTEWDDRGDIFTIAKYWIDCNHRQIAVGKSVSYARDKKLTEGDYFSMGWFRPRNAAEEQLLRILCR